MGYRGKWTCKGTFALKIGFWGEMAMQRDFWVKDGILEENGRAKGLLGQK